MNDLIESIRSNPDIAALAVLLLMLAPDVRAILQRPVVVDTEGGAVQAEVMPATPGVR